MSRRPARFTEADLNRAAKVAKRNGMVAVVRTDGAIEVRMDDGRLVIQNSAAEDTRERSVWEDRNP